MLRGEEDAGGQREGLRLLDLGCWVGVKQLVMVEWISLSSRNSVVNVMIREMLEELLAS